MISLYHFILFFITNVLRILSPLFLPFFLSSFPPSFHSNLSHFLFPLSFSFPSVILDVETDCKYQILPELATVLAALRVISDIA